MAATHLANKPDMDETVRLMQADARFEIVNPQEAWQTDLSSVRAGIRGKAAPPKVSKTFLSNQCIFNCAYCGCRGSNGCKTRYVLEPRDLATLSVKQANQNGHGVFLSSAIYKNADYTQELLIQTLRYIRRDMNYQGYVHAKVMPGASPELIWQAGQYANRLSVNIEVAKSDGYARIAKNKTVQNILTPMAQISAMIGAMQEERGKFAPRFASSQTTQLMAGSTGEDDFTILQLSGALYQKYKLKRVYYTAFHYTQPASGYDLPYTVTPPWRMARLYQADRLMQLYGFSAQEIAPQEQPDLMQDLDPKTAWALRNLHLFPLEINHADYTQLLRVPGIGITGAKRIVQARKLGSLSHEALQKLGVSLKRSRHFITCNGKFLGDTSEKSTVLHKLLAEKPKIKPEDMQLRLF